MARLLVVLVMESVGHSGRDGMVKRKVASRRFCSLQWGHRGWVGRGAQVGGKKDAKDGGLKYRNPSHFGTEGRGE